MSTGLGLMAQASSSSAALELVEGVDQTGQAMSGQVGVVLAFGEGWPETELELSVGWPGVELVVAIKLGLPALCVSHGSRIIGRVMVNGVDWIGAELLVSVAEVEAVSHEWAPG